MEHHRAGSGEPLVLVHGTGSRWQIWSPVLPALEARFEVLAVDLPGFGASEWDGTEPEPVALAQRLERWFAEVGIERPHVAGNSLGGGAALELARRGSVRSATAVSPVGFWTPKEVRWCQESLRSAGRVGALRPFLPKLAASATGRKLLLGQNFGRPERIPARDVVDTFDAYLGSAARDRAIELFGSYVFHDAEELDGVPVSILWGTRDFLLLHRQSRRARKVLPRARHVDLPGCGHAPFYDDPELVARELIAGATPRPRPEQAPRSSAAQA